MVLSVVLMATFFFGKGTQLYRGWLRWGFVCIGAAAFIDMFLPWIQSISDTSFVAIGERNGIHSDPYKILNYHGWTMDEIISTYVNLGIACSIFTIGMYTWGCRFARRQIDLPDILASNEDTPQKPTATK